MTEITLFAGSARTSGGRAGHVTQYLLKDRFAHALRMFEDWQERRRTRRDLMRLTDYQLKDIGLSRVDAENEYGKPFWRP